MPGKTKHSVKAGQVNGGPSTPPGTITDDDGFVRTTAKDLTSATIIARARFS